MVIESRVFQLCLVLLIAERIAEMISARRNEARLRTEGYIEFGRGHFWLLIAVHIGFFLSLLIESVVSSSSPILILAVVAFAIAQVGRALVFFQLGRRWTTRVLVRKGEALVRSGLYRIVRHPNYLIVEIELVFFPLIFGLWFTSLTFTILSGLVLLFVRIPLENSALAWAERSAD